MPRRRLDDKPRATLGCRENPSVDVTFRDRFSFDADSVHYAVDLRAPGLTWDSDLTTFLEELAAEYRGWDGERSWQTNDRDLTVSAVFRSGGHVGLTWSWQLRPQIASGCGASVTTWLGAGEQMTTLAAGIRHFLTGEQP
ncbi:DUF6228 family protein [Streptomyces sp. NPDC049744]|uniref:DUF6228 family protein n=1 Tax=Streptomyces sp. NPDC049744 TaxID=3154359 RepID=UPI0034159629